MLNYAVAAAAFGIAGSNFISQERVVNGEELKSFKDYNLPERGEQNALIAARKAKKEKQEREEREEYERQEEQNRKNREQYERANEYAHKKAIEAEEKHEKQELSKIKSDVKNHFDLAQKAELESIQLYDMEIEKERAARKEHINSLNPGSYSEKHREYDMYDHIREKIKRDTNRRYEEEEQIIKTKEHNAKEISKVVDAPKIEIEPQAALAKEADQNYKLAALAKEPQASLAKEIELQAALAKTKSLLKPGHYIEPPKKKATKSAEQLKAEQDNAKKEFEKELDDRLKQTEYYNEQEKISKLKIENEKIQKEIDESKLKELQLKKQRDEEVEKHKKREILNKGQLKYEADNVRSAKRLKDYANDKSIGLKNELKSITEADKIKAKGILNFGNQRYELEQKLNNEVSRQKLNDYAINKQKGIKNEEELIKRDEEIVKSRQAIQKGLDKYDVEKHKDREIAKNKLSDYATNKRKGIDKEVELESRERPMVLKAVDEVDELLTELGNSAKTATIVGGAVTLASIVGAKVADKVIETASEIPNAIYKTFKKPKIEKMEKIEKMAKIEQNEKDEKVEKVEKEELSFKSSKEKKMPNLMAERDAMNFLFTVVRHPQRAYNYLASRKSKEEITDILSAIAQHDSNGSIKLSPQMKAFILDPESPAEIIAKYKIERNDPSFKEKVPQRWLGPTKFSDKGFDKIMPPDFSYWDSLPNNAMPVPQQSAPFNAPNYPPKQDIDKEMNKELQTEEEAGEREIDYIKYGKLRERMDKIKYESANTMRKDIGDLVKLSEKIGLRDVVLDEHNDYVNNKIKDLAKLSRTIDSSIFPESILTTDKYPRLQTIKTNEFNNTINNVKSASIAQLETFLKELTPRERQIYEEKLQSIADLRGVTLNKAYDSLVDEEKVLLVKHALVDTKRWELGTGNIGSRISFPDVIADHKEMSIKDISEKLKIVDKTPISNTYEEKSDRERLQDAEKLPETSPNMPGHPEFVKTEPREGAVFDVTPVNYSNEPKLSFTQLATESASNVMNDAAAVSGSLLASSLFGPTGGFMVASIYNQYAKDLLAQNQMAPEAARNISNKIKSGAIAGYMNWEQYNGKRKLHQRDAQDEFIEGSSLLTYSEGKGRNVYARNELNDLGFETQRINPLRTVNDNQIISAEVSQAFLSRENTDLIRQGQDDYQSWFRHSAPYPVR